MNKTLLIAINMGGRVLVAFLVLGIFAILHSIVEGEHYLPFTLGAFLGTVLIGIWEYFNND